MISKTFQHEDFRKAQVLAVLKAAGESVWQRYPLPWQHPGFKSCPEAASVFLGLFPWAMTFLVMRDPCLRHVREAVLAAGRQLVIPLRGSTQLITVLT